MLDDRLRAALGAPCLDALFALAEGTELPLTDSAVAALVALERGDLPRAVELSRAATRASTPGADNTLTVVVLARVRRKGGHSHLAARLLGAAARTASPAWREWVEWELTAAGAFAEVDPLGGDTAYQDSHGDEPDMPSLASDSAAGLTHALLTAVERKEPDAIAARAAALVRRTEGFPPVANDVAALLGGLALADASRADVAAFVRGEIPTLAGGLEAFARRRGPLAWVVVPHDLAARRVVAPAQRLFGTYELSTPRPGRTELGLSVLALAPLGLDLETFFQRVYGFAFRRSIHDGVVRVLLTRMRKALEPRGEIVRSGDRLELVAHESLAIPDPRVATPSESAVSRAVAEGGGASAKELADKLDLPLRTVQAELARLVEDGVCVRRSQGRVTEYVVEDTALVQPTRFLRG